jgi:UDPglucose 6-dehydrogenase
MVAFSLKVIRDPDEFNAKSDLIAANHVTDEIKDIANKVYTLDLFGRD